MAVVEKTNIYDLNIHEEIKIDRYNAVMKVAGGWIYKSFTGTTESNFSTVGMVFVPHDDEFAPVLGCTDSGALNYNPAATLDDGSCTYPGGGR